MFTQLQSFILFFWGHNEYKVVFSIERVDAKLDNLLATVLVYSNGAVGGS